MLGDMVFVFCFFFLFCYTLQLKKKNRGMFGANKYFLFLRFLIIK